MRSLPAATILLTFLALGACASSTTPALVEASPSPSRAPDTGPWDNPRDPVYDAPPLVQTIENPKPTEDYNNEYDAPQRLRERWRPTALTLQWPMPASGVTSLFGTRPDPVSGQERFHYGIDLEGEYGLPVAAAGPGRVIYAGWNGGHGRQVVLEHEGGYRTSYSHLSQTLTSTGAFVDAGQTIGRLGNSGKSTGPHLHFETTRYGMHQDPLDLLGVRLSLE